MTTLAIWESEPSRLIANLTMALLAATPAKRNCPSGEAAREIGPDIVVPVENGELGTGARPPALGSTTNPLTLPLPPFEAYRNFPPATVMRLTAYTSPPVPCPPVENGEFGT